MLVGIDHFSRWPEAVATRAANAATVVEFMHSRIIAQHGTPRELLTDHGSHFASQVVAGLCLKRIFLSKQNQMRFHHFVLTADFEKSSFETVNGEAVDRSSRLGE